MDFPRVPDYQSALGATLHNLAETEIGDRKFRDASGHLQEAIRHLLKCIQLPIPSTNKAPGWDRAHFFPYTKSLIHWDARIRGKNLQIQRRYLRGGGALAFKVLRLISRGRCGGSAWVPD